MIRITLSAVALALVASSLFAASASAAPCTTNRVSVYNNAQYGLFWAQVFNNDDEGYVSPVAEKFLRSGERAELTCNTCGNCLVAITQGQFVTFNSLLQPMFTGPPNPSESTRLGWVQSCVTVTAWKHWEATRATWSGGC